MIKVNPENGNSDERFKVSKGLVISYDIRTVSYRFAFSAMRESGWGSVRFQRGVK